MEAHLSHPAPPPLAPDDLAVLQAVAEPTRARIVALLRHGEHCVCDVGEMLGLSNGLISHHLRTLRGVGLLRERRSGRWVYYSLDIERVGELRAALAELLTPTEAATTACRCSDCGSSGVTPRPEARRRVPLLAEVSQ